MLVVVLILTVVGFGMLVAASLTGTIAWAWAAVAASAVAAVALVMSWRRRSAANVEVDAYAYPATPAQVTAHEVTAHEVTALRGAAQEVAAHQAAVHAEPITEAVPPVRRIDPGKPVQERADPADLAFVATLDRQVLVVDEQPGYHLAGCPVLSGRPVVGVPAREAVALGFTPCGVCAPVRVLASAQSRLEHSSGKPR